MAGVNKVILIGNLGADPEVRYAKSGTAVCNLSIAVNERRKEGDQWKDHVEWVPVTLFGKTAENAGQYLSKGRQVYVEGRMQTRKYTDKEGIERWRTDVVAHQCVFIGGNPGGNGGGRRTGGAYQGKPAEDAEYDEPGDDPGLYDDDLPF